MAPGINDLERSFLLSALGGNAVPTDSLQDLRTKYYTGVNNGTIPTGVGKNAKSFGAKGDGVTDDTAALQAWLNSPGTEKVLADGVYRITSTLTVSTPKTHLVSQGATILGDAASITMINVTGANSIFEVNLDGNQKAGVGIQINVGGCTVTNSVIERIGNPTVSTVSVFGISVWTSFGVTIRNNRISNIDGGPGDGTAGNGFGMGRGIGITSNAKGVPATVPSFIENNYIENVMGEEGDSITVLFELVTMGASDYFQAGFVTIKDNIFKNASKRFVKIQATDVVVDSNKFLFDLGSVPPNWNAHIQGYRATRMQVTNNETFPVATNFAHINLQQGTSTPMYNVTIENNKLRCGAGMTEYGIFVSDLVNAMIKNNTIEGSSLCTNRVDNSIIQGNNIVSGPDTMFAHNHIGNNCQIRDNTDLSSTRTAVRWKINGGTGNIQTNNLPATP